MKKFKFRLEALQKCRKIAEDQKKKAFFAVRKKAMEKESEIESLHGQLDRLVSQWAGASFEGCSIAQMSQYGKYMENLKAKERKLQTELNGIKKEENSKRTELLEASRKRKVILKLKEKTWQRYLEEYAMEENKNMGEVAQMVFLRRTLW